MVKHELSIQINRPINEVFTFVSNLQNGPQWQSGLLEARSSTQGPVDVGTQFTSVRKFLGRKLESVVEVTAYEPFKKFTIKSASGSSPFEESYHFETNSEGTRLSTIIELHTSGLMGLAEPLIAGSLKREMEADFGNLKDLLEQQVPEIAS